MLTHHVIDRLVCMCSFNHIVHDGAVFWCIALEVDMLCIALELLVIAMYIMQQRVGQLVVLC